MNPVQQGEGDRLNIPKVVPSDQNKEEDDYFEVKRKFGKNVIKAFMPYRILLTLFGRWPLTYKENTDGTFTYDLRWYHPKGIYFIGISIYFFYLLLGGGYTFGTMLLFLTKNQSEPTALQNTTLLSGQFREAILVQRHMILLISLWTNIFLAVVTSFNIHWKYKFMMNYFSFWIRAVQTMHMDLVKGSTLESWKWVGSYLLVTFILTVMAILQFGASTSGGPVLMAIITFKLFDEDLIMKTALDPEYASDTTNFTMYRILGGIGFLYLFVGSKAFILLYLFKCKLLKKAFASWNGRIYAAILRGGDFIQTKEGRTTFTLLYKDHCVLLDLLEGTNHLFSGILESYFALQMLAVCFELYITLRSMRYGDKYLKAQDGGFFIREYDFIPSGLIFILNISILYSIASSAAKVGEEAISGLEVIRRKTMLGRKTDEELYFMLSMYNSYSSYNKLELSAGGYFYINKEFVITVLSVIFTYFIILYQFSPILDPRVPQKDFSHERHMIGQFIVYIENGIHCSWIAEDEATANILAFNGTNCRL